MQTQNKKTEVGNRKSDSLRAHRSTNHTATEIDVRRVGMGRDDAHASRRFFNQHRHAIAGCIEPLPALLTAFGFLLLTIGILAVQLNRRDAELSQLRETKRQEDAQLERFVHNVQTNNFAREALQLNSVATNGGAQ